jgi:multidrug efflux pump subunit AcrA (membrane-fusion protein)
MLSRPEHIQSFPTLTSIRPPRAAAVLAWIIGIGICLAVLVLLYVPWVQTSAGTGRVIAPNPADRVQTVTALVQGRVEHWYVEDGQRVRAGDPIARLVDNDPFLLKRLAAEREQIEAEIAAAEQAVKVAESQVSQTREAADKGFVTRRNFEAAQIRVAEQRAKLAEAKAKLSRLEVTVNRQSAQLVRAPRGRPDPAHQRGGRRHAGQRGGNSGHPRAARAGPRRRADGRRARRRPDPARPERAPRLRGLAGHPV